MAKWTSETGILRKKQQRENFDNLLVFGYACKLFRDDEKASYIDKGMHLIPWMGDEKLRIDRYDCRGALSELASCEASREGYDATRWLGLSESERKIEQLCDEERYYSLHKNEDEEAMYKEEEAKRMQQKTNEYHFNYDVQNENENSQSSNEDKPSTVEEDDRPYVPPPELDVPADITIPKTVKESARIVKTAQFISQQGSQMEILIKTKQADNPQFAFMNSTDPLYKYYRHVLQAIKNGVYRLETPSKSDQSLDESVDHDSDEHYLHPSLLTTSANPVSAPTTSVPSVPYRPTADCLYSQLVNRIQGSQLGEAVPKPDVPPPPSNATYDQQQQQYYQYYYMIQCYEYYKQMMQYHAQNYGQGEGGMDLQQIQEQMASISQYLQQQHQQHQQNSNNSYAQIVANLSQHTKDSNTNPFGTPQEPPKATVANDITKAPVLYSKQQEPDATQAEPAPVIGPQLPETVPKDNQKQNSNTNGPDLPEKPAGATTKPEEAPTKKPLLQLVHYGSDSEEEDSSSSESEQEAKKPIVSVPPEDVRIIIDKMASYVAKNGGDFEAIVKAKGDPRFSFLNGNHQFYAYYKHKIALFSENTVSVEKEKKLGNDCKEKNGLPPTKAKEKKVIAPVCFSIKKAKEEPPKDIKSALPVEESDEEDEESSNSAKENCKPVSTVPNPVTTCYTIPNSHSLVVNSESDPTSTEKVDKAEGIETEKVIVSQKNGNSDSDDPILEMIDLTYDLEERRDAKRAEDKIKDKLAAAAREKLASVARDRALQIERKRKAAAFLKLKSAESEPKTETKELEVVSPREDTPPKYERKSSRKEHKKSRKKSSDRESKRSRTDHRKRSRSRSSNRKIEKSRSKSRDIHSRSRSRSYANSPRIKSKEKSVLSVIKEVSPKRKRSKSRSKSRSRSRSKRKNREKRSESDCNDVRVVSVYKLPEKSPAEVERLTEREIVIKDDESGTEEGEIKKHKKSSKKKKSHKRKSSKSRHESKSHHKKSKKRRRSRSRSSTHSYSS